MDGMGNVFDKVFFWVGGIGVALAPLDVQDAVGDLINKRKPELKSLKRGVMCVWLFALPPGKLTCASPQNVV